MKFSQIIQTLSGACLALTLFASIAVAVPIDTKQILEIRQVFHKPSGNLDYNANAFCSTDPPLNPGAEKFIDALTNAEKIHELVEGRKFLCFYTGSTTEDHVVYPVWQHLESVKKQVSDHENGDQFITIDDLMKLLNIDTSSFQLNDWIQCSIPYAAFAEGKAVVVIGKQHSSDSVYFTVEQPTMEAGRKVDFINAYSMGIVQQKPHITFVGKLNLAEDLKADRATCRVPSKSESGLSTPGSLSRQGSPSASKGGSPQP